MSGEDGADMPSAETLRGRDDGADIGSRGRPGGLQERSGLGSDAGRRGSVEGDGWGRRAGTRRGRRDERAKSQRRPRPGVAQRASARPPSASPSELPQAPAPPTLAPPANQRPPPEPLAAQPAITASMFIPDAPSNAIAPIPCSSCACPDSPRTILLATVFHSASYYIRVSRMSCCTFPKRPTPCRNTCENCSLGERKTHRNLADDIRDEQAHRGSPAWWATRRLILMNLGLAFTSARAPSSPLSDSRAGRARHRATNATNASTPEGHRPATGLLSRVRHVTRFFVTGPRRRPPREAYKARATHKI